MSAADSEECNHGQRPIKSEPEDGDDGHDHRPQSSKRPHPVVVKHEPQDEDDTTDGPARKRTTVAEDDDDDDDGVMDVVELDDSQLDNMSKEELIKHLTDIRWYNQCIREELDKLRVEYKDHNLEVESLNIQVEETEVERVLAELYADFINEFDDQEVDVEKVADDQSEGSSSRSVVVIETTAMKKKQILVWWQNRANDYTRQCQDSKDKLAELTHECARFTKELAENQELWKAKQEKVVDLIRRKAIASEKLRRVTEINQLLKERVKAAREACDCLHDTAELMMHEQNTTVDDLWDLSEREEHILDDAKDRAQKKAESQWHEYTTEAAKTVAANVNKELEVNESKVTWKHVEKLVHDVHASQFEAPITHSDKKNSARKSIPRHQ